MAVNNIKIIKNPSKNLLGKTALDFLHNINNPFWLFIEGEDTSRARVVTTLLHGNEPSGIHGLHKWLLLNKKPAVNIYFFIGAVNSALQQPCFSNRYLPNGQDLNRCFRPGVGGEGGSIAISVMDLINKINPEAVLDLHDTTSPGESFAIAVQDSSSHRKLSSFFTDKLVINHMRLGSIMESNRNGLPIVTIECGGHNDPLSIKTAFMGIESYCEEQDLWHDVNNQQFQNNIKVYNKPYRLEYINNGEISFGSELNNNTDLTILNTYSNKNFKSMKKGQVFALTKSKDLSIFKAFIDNPSNDFVSEYFTCDKGQVIVKQDITVFMLTNNPFISKNDCVCYFTVS